MLILFEGNLVARNHAIVSRESLGIQFSLVEGFPRCCIYSFVSVDQITPCLQQLYHPHTSQKYFSFFCFFFFLLSSSASSPFRKLLFSKIKNKIKTLFSIFLDRLGRWKENVMGSAR